MLLSAVFMTAWAAAFAVEAGGVRPPQGATAQARALLGDALRATNDPNLTPSGRAEVLNSAIVEAKQRLEPLSPVAEKLTAATAEAERKRVEDQYADLKRAVSDVLADLTFEPKLEASLPKGFPSYTPVGSIEVKEYPAYRMAKGANFWTLFMHIQRNQIEMTAPVEMSYSSSKDGRLKESGMAFLYGDRTIGTPGERGNVNVIDNGPQKVVSIGIRGGRSSAAMSDAQDRLLKWIDGNQQFKATGEMRVMGYNSPAVPRNRQFFEVQIPVTKVPKSEEPVRVP